MRDEIKTEILLTTREMMNAQPPSFSRPPISTPKFFKQFIEI